MSLETLKQEIESLKQEITGIAKGAAEKSAAETKELADKVTSLQKELSERKHTYDVGTLTSFKSVDRKEADTKMDELFIASALCTKADGSFDKAKYLSISTKPEYAEARKASGFTFNPATPDGQVTGADGSAAGYGDDFIPVGYSSTLIQEIFLKLQVAGIFNRINMPNPTFTFPFTPGRVSARFGHEGTAVTKDVIASGALQFTAKKLMSNIDFTDELEQDGVLAAILPLVRTKLIDGYALAQEKIAINGDVTAGAGHIQGNIAADDAARAVAGLRKLSNANISLATPGFTLAGLRALRAGMGKYGIAPSDLVYVMCIEDYFKCVAFPEFQYLYQYGPGATILTGELGRIDGIPIIVSEILPRNLNATGVYDGTTTTKGAVMCVNKSGFAWGDRKQFDLKLYNNIYTQVTSLVGSQRLDFQKIMLSNETPVAVGINYNA